jgi:hypothetical protein
MISPLSPEEEDYRKSLQRIRDAAEANAPELNLRGLFNLRSFPRELEVCTSIQTLKLGVCYRLGGGLSPLRNLNSLQFLELDGCSGLSGDLSPLVNLASLRSLNLRGCKQLSGDLTSLAELTSLQTLDLSGCSGIRRFGPIEALLPTLEKLYLFGCKFEDLHSEVCGESYGDNVLDQVRAHYEDLKFGQQPDAEVKVLYLG